MKTWEMIKELTENPEKKFKAIVKGEEVLAEVRERINISDTMSYPNTIGLYTSEDGWEVFPINNCTNKHDWTEVIEPVDFLTAWKDVVETDKDVMSYVSTENVVMFKDNDNMVTLGFEDANLNIKGYIDVNVEWEKVYDEW